MLAVHLLQSSLVLVNTLIFQRILVSVPLGGRLIDRDRKVWRSACRSGAATSPLATVWLASTRARALSLASEGVGADVLVKCSLCVVLAGVYVHDLAVSVDEDRRG